VSRTLAGKNEGGKDRYTVLQHSPGTQPLGPDRTVLLCISRPSSYNMCVYLSVSPQWTHSLMQLTPLGPSYPSNVFQSCSQTVPIPPFEVLHQTTAALKGLLDTSAYGWANVHIVVINFVHRRSTRSLLRDFPNPVSASYPRDRCIYHRYLRI